MVSTEVAAELAFFDIHPVIILTVVPVLLVLATIALSLRVYTRAVVIRAFGLDDWLLLAAYAVFVAGAFIYIAFATIEKDQGILEPVGKLGSLIMAAIATYLLDQILLKCSLAVFFLRVVNQRWQKIVIYVSLTIYVLYIFIFFWITLFQDGTPTAHHLITSKAHIGHRVFGPMNWIAGILNVIIDWIFTITPIFVVAKAMMPRRAKISVCFLIALGALGSAASIARLPYIPLLAHQKGRNFFATIQPIAIASIAETSLGIIAISLATLRPLFSRCLDLSTIKRSTKKSTRMSALPPGLHSRNGGITRRTEVDIESDQRNTFYMVPEGEGSEDALNKEESKQAVASIKSLTHSAHGASGPGFEFTLDQKDEV